MKKIKIDRKAGTENTKALNKRKEEKKHNVSVLNKLNDDKFLEEDE